MKIFPKLFITFSASFIVVIAMMIGFISWNLEERFTGYVRQIEIEEMERSAKVFEDYYGEVRTWRFIKSDPRIANVILDQRGRFDENIITSRSDGSSIIEKEYRYYFDEIRKNKKPVIFISGHFNNFELMALHIEKSGINLAAIYRPLNNKFLNYIMERVRKKYICKNQIKKGISGTKQLLGFFKKKTSIALMIDQRVSQGIKAKFFNDECFTTTIPAQFVKKFKCKIIPVYIERIQGTNFQITIHEPINFSGDETIESITLNLNGLLEKMILKNPEQWIWSHNRWK